MNVMNQFPLEIVQHILQYDGRIKYRNGKFMNQITPDDDRYKMLKIIPEIFAYSGANKLWYMSIISQPKNFAIDKYMCEYSSENSSLKEATSNTMRFYCYTNHDVRYVWSKIIQNTIMPL